MVISEYHTPCPLKDKRYYLSGFSDFEIIFHIIRGPFGDYYRQTPQNKGYAVNFKLIYPN